MGVELVPLLKNKTTGNPRKDPNTGYMMNHSLPSSDVTRAQDPKHTELPAYPRQSPLEEKKTYYTELANQVVSKVNVSIHMLKRCNNLIIHQILTKFYHYHHINAVFF